MIWILTTIPILLRRLQRWIAVALLLVEGRQRLFLFYHPSIHQLSTLEKTKLRHRPILSSVLSTSFQRIACGGAPGAWLASRSTTGLPPFYHISQLSHSRDSDFHNFLLPKLSDAEDDRVEGALAIRLIIGLNFAVTLSSPDSSCVLFDITPEQSVGLKWRMVNKYKRWFHSSRVKFPLVSMSASWVLVSIYLIWIFWVQIDSIE